MEENKAVIYGVKTGDTYHYIGKTTKINSEGQINPSAVSSQYMKPELRTVFTKEPNVKIEQLLSVPKEEWWDEKLEEVVEKHSLNHPLQNAQWMKDGKRGITYWEGKTRDPHTLQRLSESKYKKILQYDLSGNLIKIWKSGKEVATEVFGDYRVVNGCGCTKFYPLLTATTLKGRRRYKSYWFKAEEMPDAPKKIDLVQMLKDEKIRQSAVRKKTRPRYYFRYSVIRYDENDEVIATYENTAHAAYELRTSIRTVTKLCRHAGNGIIINDNCILKYGPKTHQDIDPEYPRYKPKPLKKPKKKTVRSDGTPLKRKKAEPRVRTETRTMVELWVNNERVALHRDVAEAATAHKISPALVRRICSGYDYLKKYPDLRFGVKLTTVKK